MVLLTLQPMAGTLPMTRMNAISCRHQAGVRVLRLPTPPMHHQAMTGTHHAWMTGGATGVCTLPVRTLMTGPQQGCLTIPETMHRAGTQVCMLQGMAMMVKDQTMASRPCMAMMLPNHAQGCSQETVMGTPISAATHPLHPPRTPARAATGPPALKGPVRALTMTLETPEAALTTWSAGCRMGICHPTTGVAATLGTAPTVKPGSSTTHPMTATMQVLTRQHVSWTSFLFRLHKPRKGMMTPVSTAALQSGVRMTSPWISASHSLGMQGCLNKTSGGLDSRTPSSLAQQGGTPETLSTPIFGVGTTTHASNVAPTTTTTLGMNPTGGQAA